MESERRKILFVVNPISGRKPATNFTSLVSQRISEKNIQYEIYETRGKDDRKQIRQIISRFHPDTVAAVGGDGTVNQIASELTGTNISLGIIPNGSANGLAYNLNIPNNVEQALDITLAGKSKPADVIRINNRHYCIHLADVGINARIVKRFEKEGSKGMLGYGKQMFKELLSPKTSFSFTIETSEFSKKTRAEMLVIANAESYGTGIKINPNGKIDDGKFEVVAIKPYPWWFVLTFILKGFTGRLHTMKHVRVWNVTEAKIRMKKKLDFQIDGEVVENVNALDLKIMRDALNVIYA